MMPFTSIDIWIFAISVTAALACALPGGILVLRGNALMTDAISHAILPGIAIAFIITGLRNSLPMFLGAVFAAVLLSIALEYLHKVTRSDAGALLGILFSIFFSLGLLLMARGASDVDLDPSCVLFGALELTPLLSVSVLGLSMPPAFLQLFILACVHIVIFFVFKKEISLFIFDPLFAKMQGIPVNLIRYILIADIAITNVALFEIAGSIMTIALFVIPAATAQLFTKRLLTFFLATIGFGIIAMISGFMLSIGIPLLTNLSDTSIAGGASVTAFIILIFALLIQHHLKTRNTVFK